MTTLALASLLLGTPQSQDIRNYVQSNFEDATLTVVTGAKNNNELAKINKDFAQSYRVKSSQVWLKEPFKLKMVSTIEDTQVIFIVNGGKKTTRAPRSNISITSDVSKKPGQRQTAFDFGILTPSMMETLFDAKFVRMDRSNGDAIFDLTYKSNLKDSSRYRVWLDPNQKSMTKREWYGQDRNDNRLMATFFYNNLKKVNGVWIATEVAVRNANNVQAGTLNYTDIKANIGIADSVFTVK